MNFALPEETLDKILAYLTKCPYNEVSVIIDEIKANVKSVTLTPAQPEGGDTNVQSTQTQSEQQTESSQEGGNPDQSQEPENGEQQG